MKWFALLLLLLLLLFYYILLSRRWSKQIWSFRTSAIIFRFLSHPFPFSLHVCCSICLNSVWTKTLIDALKTFQPNSSLSFFATIFSPSLFLPALSVNKTVYSSLLLPAQQTYHLLSLCWAKGLSVCVCVCLSKYFSSLPCKIECVILVFTQRLLCNNCLQL